MCNPNAVQPDEAFNKCLDACKEDLQSLTRENVVEIMIQTGCENPIDRTDLLSKYNFQQLVLKYCRDCHCNNHFPYAVDDDPGDGTEQPSLILAPRAS